MDEKVKLEWGRRLTGELFEKCLDINDEMIVNLLEAYGIPCIRLYPNDGDFGRLILGTSGTGVEIYVPKTMYEDAVNLSEGSAEFDEEL